MNSWIKVEATPELQAALTEAINRADKNLAPGTPLFELMSLLAQVQIARVLKERAA